MQKLSKNVTKPSRRPNNDKTIAKTAIKQKTNLNIQKFHSWLFLTLITSEAVSQDANIDALQVKG